MVTPTWRCHCKREWGLSVDGHHAVLIDPIWHANEKILSIGRSDNGMFVCLHKDGSSRMFDLRGPVQVQRKKGEHEQHPTQD